MNHTTVPEEIRRLVIAHHIGTVERMDVVRAQSAMVKLGISSDCEFYAFCSEFCLGNLLSTSSYESLVDVSEPTEEVTVGTQFIREVWELPTEFICFTTCQGEGGYLYSTRTKGVYDFSLSDRKNFIERPAPEWPSFFEFLAWYLSPSYDEGEH